MSKGAIEQIFSDLIDNFRAQERKLNASEKEQIDQSQSLSNPCQIYVVSSFDHSHHLIIKTHSSAFKDKQIRFIQLSQNNFATELSTLIKTFQWIENSNQYEYKKNPYGSLVESIIRFGNDINYSITNPTKLASHNVTQRLSIFDQIFTWKIVGKIEEWDFNEEFKLSSVARVVESVSGQSGLLTSFFPPVLIGKLASMMEDRILQNYSELKKNISLTKINNIPVVVLKGGLLGVETSDLSMAEKIFNTIMATALVCGVPAYLVRKGEIAGIYFDKNTSEIRLNKIMHSSFRMDMITSTLSNNNCQGYLRMRISLSDLQTIMNYCTSVWGKPNDQKYLDLIINGFTLLKNENYSSAFLIFWTIIEIHLFGLWSNKLQTAVVTNKRQQSLKKMASPYGVRDLKYR